MEAGLALALAESTCGLLNDPSDVESQQDDATWPSRVVASHSRSVYKKGIAGVLRRHWWKPKTLVLHKTVKQHPVAGSVGDGVVVPGRLTYYDQRSVSRACLPNLAGAPKRTVGLAGAGKKRWFGGAFTKVKKWIEDKFKSKKAKPLLISPKFGPGDVCTSVVASKFRTPEEADKMSDDDCRNTLITEINKVKNNEGKFKDLQGKQNADLIKMVSDDLGERGARQGTPVVRRSVQR